MQDAAARNSTDTWNAFEGADSGAASAAPAAAAHGDSWANFGEAGSQQKTAQAAKAADPVAVCMTVLRLTESTLIYSISRWVHTFAILQGILYDKLLLRRAKCTVVSTLPMSRR